ncbi:MAG: sulfatase-like hydrolase/transferase [Acidobacteriota bacterium]|nr:sulfatase-like hydrolase/transferase [Acidobacteriota bacterium]MDQ7087421.1 sulfatase-like hydrolase/transferase [Acidobacteriota bacterium]
MIDPRRWSARVANLGLVVFGLAVVVLLGTGGTRVHLGTLGISLFRLTNPLQGLFLFAALRVLTARRGAGLEGWLIRFYARQGMAPRHAPAGPPSALRSGVWLGAGFGTVLGLVDALRVLTAGFHPGPRWLDAIALLLLSVLAGWLLGAGLGAAFSMTALGVGRLFGARPGRYALGRWTVAFLLAVSPLPLRWGSGTAPPGRLLFLAALALVVTATVFLLLPAVVLRARRGSWGLAITSGGALALAVGLLATGAVGPALRDGNRPAGTHPNLLLVSVSGLRADVLSLYRSRAEPTPNFDALAYRGVHFRAAQAPSTSVVSSAASLLTGLYPSSHRQEGPVRGWRPPSLPGALASHGYATAAFVSWRRLDGQRTGLADYFHVYDDLTGLQDWLARATLGRFWRSFSRVPGRSIRPAGETVERFRHWLGRSSGGPWCAWVELAGPARPTPRPSASGRRAGEVDPIPLPPRWADPDQRSQPLNAWLRGYQEQVLEADRAVGEMWELLRARGELHRTIVVLVAEHGICLGEGGVWFEAGSALPEGVLHVPWIVAGPGVDPGGSVQGPASLVDVAPTVLGLIGLASGRRCEGEDLSRYLVDPRSIPRDPQSGPVFSESLPGPVSGDRLYAVRFGPWKLVRHPDGSERFYIIEGVEREVLSFRGRQERLRRQISDMLGDWLARR